LFLRKSQVDEIQITPGFRLTGGDGLQGLFSLAQHPSEEVTNCKSAIKGSIEPCIVSLEASQTPVSMRYRGDPLLKKYDSMPVASFLKEVQATADSLGYAPQTEAGK
jgi:hypothetical protein